MVPMSKSILDEKGKVPLQELSGKTPKKGINKNPPLRHTHTDSACQWSQDVQHYPRHSFKQWIA